jgi:hydroxyethylthiazole kinase
VTSGRNYVSAGFGPTENRKFPVRTGLVIIKKIIEQHQKGAMTKKLNPYALLKRVRIQKPIIHHLTNWVTIYDCANVVKVLGASPVMAHAREEVAQMTEIASALVLNIGTLTPDLVEAMKVAAQAANDNDIPVVLDVCGAGATRLRDQACHRLLAAARIDIIKGNASEVARVNGAEVRTRGVDAARIGQDLAEVARELARKRRCTVVATGREDLVADEQKLYVVRNGHPLMAHLVGTGCMAASVIGTFAAVEADLTYAAAAGLVCFEVAAEGAAKESAGPGTFKEKLFDCLYHLDKKTIDRLQKVEVCEGSISLPTRP